MNRSEPNLDSFYNFIGKHLAPEAAGSMTLEDALSLWKEEQTTLAAIREGLVDVAAGRTKSLAEFDRDFRQAHGI